MNLVSAFISPSSAEETALSQTESLVIRTLLYFEIFNHPLLFDEIIQCMGKPVAQPELIKTQVEQMLRKGYIHEHRGYYLVNCNKDAIQKRIEGEKLAHKYLKKARFFSSIIARFPFIRSICLSGSISKYYMDKKSDIDYFIITKPGRMWVARTFLVLFKKIFLLNSKKYFCVNYFITEESMDVRVRNIYSAMEMSSLIPTYNYSKYETLMSINAWVKDFYTNFPNRGKEWVIKNRTYFIKPLLERFFGGVVGEKLDIFCYRLTLRHWKKKFSHFDPSTFDHRLRNGRNESKHHPLGYQQIVLQKLLQKTQQFEFTHKLSLSE